jgi:hypothetical protein
MPPDFVVLSAEVEGEERFFVVLPGVVPHIMPPPSSATEMLHMLQRYMRMPPLMSEDELRVQLTEIGVPADAIEGHIREARKSRQTPLVIEHITEQGYRNADGQVVVRKTGLAGTLPNQRIYVMRCEQCAHEYGRNGCDIHSSQCPNCQDGQQGLPITPAVQGEDQGT